MRTIFAFATALLLQGCHEVEDPARYTREYYSADHEARREKIKRCTRNGGFTRQDQSCINARASLASEGIGSFKDLPPMGLLSESEAESKREERK